MSTMFRKRKDSFFLFEQNRLSARLENELELINLKCELLNVNSPHAYNIDENTTGEENTSRKSLKKIEHRMDTIEKMRNIHKIKTASFRTRVVFFESFVANNAHRKHRANQTTLLSRILIKEAERKHQLKKFEVVMLELRKEKLRAKLDKYRKFYAFFCESHAFFGQTMHDCQVVKKIVDENTGKTPFLVSSNKLKKWK